MQGDSMFLFYEIIRKIPGLLILGAAVYYLIKKRNVAGWILIIGQAGSTMTGVLLSIWQRSMMLNIGKESASYFTKMKLVGNLGFYFYIIFAVGIFMVILNAVKSSPGIEYQLLDDSIKQESEL